MSSVNLNNLSIQEFKKLVKYKNEEVKKLEQEKEKERLILAYKKLQNKEQKLSQVESKSIPKPKSKPKTKSKQKIKTFNEYFQECIKNKTIPKDTPHYFKKALERAMKEYEEGIILEKSALANFAEKYVIEGLPGKIPIEFFREKATQIKDFLRNYRNTKVRMLLVCEMEKQIIEKSNGETKTNYEHDKAYFQSLTYINLEKTEVKVFLKEIIMEILGNIITYQKKGSGWYFKEIIRLEIHTVEYKPMKGGSYIPLPELIKKKNALNNIKNEDDKCFLWSVLRYLHPVQKNGERISDLKKYENDLNFKQINFTVKVKDITKFENQNSDLPGINVFSLDDKNKIYPLRHNQKDCQNSIDLFLYSEDEKQHYSLIKNFSRLVRSQITKDTTRKLHFCKKCLYHYTKEDLLEKHLSYCGKNETAAVKMPTKNTIFKFQNHHKKLPIPFTIYADFECFTIPVNSCQPNQDNPLPKVIKNMNQVVTASILKL